MMNIRSTVFLFVLLFGVTQLFAQWTRQDSIAIPDLELNVGHIGNIVSGVDTDGDGNVEIFMANDNSGDSESEIIPRLYKLESDGAGGWNVVWNVELAIEQNTWPALTVDDLDGDGKEEIIWGPVNNFISSANPPRIVVYEAVGDGSDDMGVSDGFGGFLPNTEFSIVSEDNLNMRPTRWVIKDVDADGTKEVIFNDRRGTSSGWYFGVLSVSDVPDNGDGSETWTVESNGLTVTGGPISGVENKWDVAVLDDVIYLYDEISTTRVQVTGPDTYVLLEDQAPAAMGGGPFNSVQVYDIDGNAQEEIILGPYWTPYAAEGTPPGIWVYEYDAVGDSLVGTMVVDLSEWLADGGRAGGSAIGDVDFNGKTDFILGSRFATPNATIFRAEYQGAQDDVSNPDNWTVEVIDSSYASGGFWNVVNAANIDDDPNLEVLYTSSYDASTPTRPVVILDVASQATPGVWQLDEIQYAYDGVVDTTGSVHGIAVDGSDRLWVGTFSNGLHVFNSDGSFAMRMDSVTVQADGGGDSTVFLTGCRGLAIDGGGNLIYTKSGGTTLRINPDNGEVLARVELPGSQGAPMVDEEGFIYSGQVVGVTPVNVINPSSFTVTQTIDLDPLAGGFMRGLYVSEDGKTIIPGNLAEGVHSLYVYESQDFLNYPLADSIRNDNSGAPIFAAQSVTLDRSSDGKFWVSQDNAYSGTQDVNALVWFDPRDNTYGYVWMPDDNGDDTDGPRGVGFNSDGTVMYTGSFNNGVVYKYTGVFTSLRRHEDVVKPENYTLKQNYPNPFNPTTTIDFKIANSGRTVLTVYNVLGQKVLTLVNRNLTAGEYSISFDASKLASGTYIYKLKSGDFSQTKKMTLIK